MSEEKVFKTKIPLHIDLKLKLADIRKKRGFNPKEWIEEKTDMLNKYMKKCGLKGCVINCSGGIDSSVTVGLIHAASKKEGSPIKKIVGIQQPIHSNPMIQDRAVFLSKMCDLIKIDQTPIFDDLSSLVEKTLKIDEKSDLTFQRGQLKSYMRTPVAYYVSQLLGKQGFPSVVVGTGNFDEDGYLYYFCKAGDGIADIQLINELHKSEVYSVGAALLLHSVILLGAPSADLWQGQTDEDELGFSYDFVELYTEYINLSKKDREEMLETISSEALEEFKILEEKIQKHHNRNKHKETYPFNINIKKLELRKAVHVERE